MATLFNTTPAATYKDLLTVASDTPNQGLESSLKRIFDGDGIGSPLWVSTTEIQVGLSSDTANLEVYGRVTARDFALRTAISGTEHTTLSINEDGSVNFIRPIVTKSSVTFKSDGADDIVMDASNSSMQRGDGSKGNVKLGSTDVTLQKGSTDLLTAKEDGTIRFQNISSGNEPTPTAGDLVLIDGELQIGV
jgi:hypothetical protein